MPDVARAELPALFYSPPATRRGCAPDQTFSDPGAESASQQQASCSALATVAFPRPSEDCGVCVNCLDKRKFGGPGLKKRGCLARKAISQRRNSDVSGDSDAAAQPVMPVKDLSGTMMEEDMSSVLPYDPPATMLSQEPAATPATQAPLARTTACTNNGGLVDSPIGHSPVQPPPPLSPEAEDALAADEVLHDTQTPAQTPAPNET
eukprot:6198184-Pleurochrysis_carterae.AAC.2